LVAAAAITPTTIQLLEDRNLTQVNYRRAHVASPGGIAIVASAFGALLIASPLFQLVDDRVFEFGVAGLLYVIGVGFLGLIDDVAGSSPYAARGWRGHVQSLLAGRPSTGVIKALGSLALALYLFADPAFHPDNGHYFLAVLVLVLATNFFNLLDVRPGRAGKAFVLLGAGLTIGAPGPELFWRLSIWIGPIIVFLRYDLQERAMLGDTGSNVIGAVAGLWLVGRLSTTGLAVAAGILVLITLYGEFRSISAFVERTPGLRQLDLLGRSHA
jgi:UDP-N-acetylmuramyl pentapeptide phosphotransferase/UDP-N-acetylglucosamine-1-phosphate transferase